jgi:hypothetical protein
VTFRKAALTADNQASAVTTSEQHRVVVVVVVVVVVALGCNTEVTAARVAA